MLLTYFVKFDKKDKKADDKFVGKFVMQLNNTTNNLSWSIYNINIS